MVVGLVRMTRLGSEYQIWGIDWDAQSLNVAPENEQLSIQRLTELLKQMHCASINK